MPPDNPVIMDRDDENSNVQLSAARGRLRHQGTSNLTDSFLSSLCGRKKGLVWSNINMRLMDKPGKSPETNGVKKDILKNVWGKAEAGKTTAIMGASGAGKTSLFQTLTGRVSSQGKIEVEADVYLGGARINPNDQDHRRLFAYVAQEDSLHESSTIREALTFSAKLRLPSNTSEEEIADSVDHCIKELGLGAVGDSIIGGGMKKGISGGEKRRVSIGVELVANPSIIFLDEPTSGLDSFAAAKVMDLLHRVAQAGNTVVFTIHQPSSKIFFKFDNLILLNKGRVMHQGEVAQIASDFEAYGKPVPKNYNPADWIIDVAQTESMEDLERMGFFATETADHLIDCSEDAAVSVPERHKVSWFEEFRLLYQREFRSLSRNPLPIMINVGTTSFLAIIFGIIFFDVGRQDRTDPTVVQSQLGAAVNVLISTMMGQAQGALFTFSSGRPVFVREYSTDHYTIVPYFLSKLWSEALNSFAAMFAQALIVYWLMGFQMSFGELLAVTYTLAMTATAVAVLLGAFFTDAKNAASLFSLVVVPQFYFSGLFISIELIPVWVRWGQYLCSLTYASRLAMAYEFGSCDAGQAQENCDTILDRNNVDPDDTWWYWLALLVLFVAFRYFGITVLRSKVQMKSYSSASSPKAKSALPQTKAQMVPDNNKAIPSGDANAPSQPDPVGLSMQDPEVPNNIPDNKDLPSGDANAPNQPDPVRLSTQDPEVPNNIPDNKDLPSGDANAPSQADPVRLSMQDPEVPNNEAVSSMPEEAEGQLEEAQNVQNEKAAPSQPDPVPLSTQDPEVPNNEAVSSMPEETDGQLTEAQNVQNEKVASFESDDSGV